MPKTSSQKTDVNRLHATDWPRSGWMTHEAESFTRNLPFLRPSNKGNRYKPPPWSNDKVQTFTIGLAAGVPSSQCPELLVHVAIKTPPT